MERINIHKHYPQNTITDFGWKCIISVTLVILGILAVI